MRDPVYHIQMKSAMGVKQGKAEVQLQSGQVRLELLGCEDLFSGEFTPGYLFEATGSLKTALRELPGILRGCLTEDRFQAVFHSEQGDFPMEGILEQGPDKQQ